MFDFRYHALSLVAVFLALAIGILLGVTIAAPRVSEVERDLRASLRGDLVEARHRAREAADQVDRRDRLIAEALPRLVADRLSGRRVALVASGSLPGSLEGAVREAVEDAGGAVDSVSALDPAEATGAAAEALGERVASTDGARAAPAAVGRRIGAAIVRGNRVARGLERGLPDRFRGDYAGADAVAFFRAPGSPDDVEDADAGGRRLANEREGFEDGLLSAIEQAGVPVVGVEESSTEPSGVPWYEQRRLTSVDSVDLAGGRLALVYALAGRDGTFGFKDTADRPLPELAAGE